MSSTTTPAVQTITLPQNSFTIGSNGLPQFWPNGFTQAPAGATPITYTQRVLWSANPNLVWNAALGAPITPHWRMPLLALYGLLTAAERLAVAQASETVPGVQAGLVLAQMEGFVDFTDPNFPPWIGLLTSGTTPAIDPVARLPYVLAGLPPS